MLDKKYKFSRILLILIIIVLTFELFRDTFTKTGDFIGYVLVGNHVMKGENIYTNPLINTWPPFFSIASVPIAIVDNFNKYLVRFIWLSLSILAMYKVIKYVVKMTIRKQITLFPINNDNIFSQYKINVLHWLILVPVMVILRYWLDNLANIQINIFMLFFAVMTIYFFTQNKDILAALILAFSISLKVYTIFLLLYFIVKREYKISLFTILFTFAFASIPFLVFGIEQTLDYYSFWYHSAVEPFASVAHKNQSFFSMLRSLLTHESPGVNQPLNKEIYINILNLPLQEVKIVSYTLLAIAGAIVLFIFRKKIETRDSLKNFMEYALVLTVIPILSPLAWKAYFIFLFPAYFLNYLFIYNYKNRLNIKLYYLLKVFYFLSIILTVFSTELFLGSYWSDMMEVYSAITIGTILIAINIIIIYIFYDKFVKEV